jgi:hypothetical protein
LKRLISLVSIGLFVLAACDTQQAQEAEPTATLAPIVSMTPRFTATPVPSRTPLPTFTFTPSETPIPPSPTLSLTPTEAPPLIGIVSSLQLVNVRNGPGVTFRAIEAVAAGTGLEVIGQDAEGVWYNVRLEDGQEGWVSARLLRLQDTPTPIPSATPSPDLTAIFLGTPLPTAVLGGGTVTPTPPRSIVSPTPVGEGTEEIESPEDAESTDQPLVPIIDITAINLTATALAGGIVTPTFTPTNGFATPTLVGSTAGDSPTSVPGDTSITQIAPGEAGDVRSGVDVLALCDDPLFGRPAPTNLSAGSTVDVFWAWFATTRTQIGQHISAATYEVRVDGILLTDLSSYRTRTFANANASGDFAVYWYVPVGPLAAGEHQITYRVTWDSAITDGYKFFGPGTAVPFEEGSCTFTVR